MEQGERKSLKEREETKWGVMVLIEGERRVGLVSWGSLHKKVERVSIIIWQVCYDSR